jgi:hypothetical protein
MVIDEPYDNENIDDRDGSVYSWRQVLDEAWGILDHAFVNGNLPSSSSTISYSSPTANTSLKRKPKTDK